MKRNYYIPTINGMPGSFVKKTSCLCYATSGFPSVAYNSRGAAKRQIEKAINWDKTNSPPNSRFKYGIQRIVIEED